MEVGKNIKKILILFSFIFIALDNLEAQCSLYSIEVICDDIKARGDSLKLSEYKGEKKLFVYTKSRKLKSTYSFFNNKLLNKSIYVISGLDTNVTSYTYNDSCKVCSTYRLKNILYDDSLATDASYIVGFIEDRCKFNTSSFTTYYNEYGVEVGPKVYFNEDGQISDVYLMPGDNGEIYISYSYEEEKGKLRGKFFCQKDEKGRIKFTEQTTYDSFGKETSKIIEEYSYKRRFYKVKTRKYLDLITSYTKYKTSVQKYHKKGH